MAQVSSTIEIKATPKQCFEVINDYESYPEFSKETKKVSVVKKSASVIEATFTISLIKTVSYTIKITSKPPYSVKWVLVKGDMMKKNEGEWILEEVKKGVTKATYIVDLELNLMVPSMISKKLVGNSLPGMLKDFKNRIEKLHS